VPAMPNSLSSGWGAITNRSALMVMIWFLLSQFFPIDKNHFNPHFLGHQLLQGILLDWSWTVKI
jgi:hypothetical protein